VRLHGGITVVFGVGKVNVNECFVAVEAEFVNKYVSLGDPAVYKSKTLNFDMILQDIPILRSDFLLAHVQGNSE
jgi:hypothetical protein